MLYNAFEFVKDSLYLPLISATSFSYNGGGHESINKDCTYMGVV